MAASSRGASPSQSTLNRGAPSAIALIIYPVTLIVGSIFSVISPTARPITVKPLAPTIATDVNVPSRVNIDAVPVNYFARKDNIFNVYFAKIGWVWFTTAFVLLLLTQPYFTRASFGLRGKRYAQALLRYALVTLSWYLTTQWFFGPAIIERTFVLTGGKCEALTPAANTWEEIKLILTEHSCRAAGGSWRGGHDVSGHVFMLVLGSAFLGFEALGAASYFNVAGSTAKAKDDSEDERTVDGENDDDDYSVSVYARRFVWGVVGLTWWMLFMTAIWFHTWLEKVRLSYMYSCGQKRLINSRAQFSGLALSFTAMYMIYLLPQSFPPWRDIVGVPGL